jgi:outer membrane protein OmpA-like peptidoglycan-associated protein
MRFPGFALTLALAAALPLPSLAQALTDDELLQLFQNQRDAYTAVKRGFGQTRGLTLVTLGEDAPQTESPTLGQPAADGALTALTTGTDAAAGTGGQPGTLSQPTADTVAVGDTTTAAPLTTASTTAAAATSGAATTDVATQVAAVGVFPEELQVNVQIRFDFDSAKLNADQKPQLTQLCNVMKKSDIGLFQIIGHTDASGADAYNERLSQLRAEEVQRYFVADCGIEPARLQALGMGERLLRDTGDPDSADNRRVEFQALS